LAKALSQGQGPLGIAISCQNLEFFAANAGEQIGFTQRFAQTVGQASEEDIATGMQDPFIPSFEVINIDQAQSCGLAQWALGKLACENPVHSPAVWQSRQWACHSLLAQPDCLSGQVNISAFEHIHSPGKGHICGKVVKIE
jgi:hypothetical protein